MLFLVGPGPGLMAFLKLMVGPPVPRDFGLGSPSCHWVAQLGSGHRPPRPYAQHTFTQVSCFARGIPRGLLQRAEQHPPHQHAAGQGDVFLLIRQWMSDEVLSQPPLLVWPETWRSRATTFLGRLATSPTLLLAGVDDDRSSGLLKLADVLERSYGSVYRRGCAYLKDLAECRPYDRPLANLTWLAKQPSRFDHRRVCFKVAPDEVFIPRRMHVAFAVDQESVHLE